MCMKRKISSLLALCLALLFLNTAAVSAEETALTDDEITAAEMLAALGVIDDFDLSTYNPREEVARGEFACFVARLLKADRPMSDAIYYYDVPSGHWAYDAITSLTELGYLSGDGDRLFRPDETIKTCDAYSVLIKALGYGTRIGIWTDYETGCLRTAAALKLSDGYSPSESLTMGDMYISLKNSLTIDMYEVAEISDDSIKYERSGTQTLLSLYYDSYYNEGIVTGAEAMGIDGSRALDRGEIEIDNLVYNSVGRDYTDYFGCRVAYIYSEEESGNRKIIWIGQTGKSSVTDISAEDGECWFDATSMTLSYYENSGSNTLKKKRISNGAAVIYNGENYEDGGLDTLLPGKSDEATHSRDMRIRLISSGGSSPCDAVVIDEYETFCAEAVDKNAETVYGDNQRPYSMDKGKADYVTLKNDAGAEILFDEITEGDIISYAKSRSGSVINALISRKTVEGTVTELSSETPPVITLDDTKYRCENNGVASKIKPGSRMKLYFDAFSRVYDAEVITFDCFLAYIIDASANNAVDEWVKLKVLDESGNIAVYKLAPRVTVNGEKYTGCAASYNALFPQGSKKNQLVLCTVNKENEISAIETSSYEDRLTLATEPVRALYKSNSGKFGAKVIIDQNTKIFAVPDEYDMAKADDEDFMIKKKSQLLNDTNYTVESYIVDEETEFADAIIVYGHDWSTPSASTPCVLIESINSMLNSDGVTVDGIRGYSAGEGVRMAASTGVSLAQYRSGDVVRVFQNDKQEITRLDLIYRIGNTYETSGYSSTINSATRFVVVHANDKTGGVVKVGYKSGADYDELFNLKNARVLVYNKNEENGGIELGSYADVLTYNGMGGTGGSDMVIQTNYGSIVFVAIYND